MKKLWLTVLAVSTTLILGLFTSRTIKAEVNVSITVPLPGLVLPAPPGLVVIPGTYVYYPPDVGVDIFFYRGYWYRPYRGGWYTAYSYNGPWRVVGRGRVPRVLYNLPPGFRRMPPRHERMPYSLVQRNWRSWEHERHWDDARYERGDRGEHERWEHGRGRGHGRNG